MWRSSGARPRHQRQVAGRPKMTAGDLVAFLEGSFGAFQQRQRGGVWRWTEQALAGYITELARHGLILADAEQHYELTPLGRLAGESGIAVESVLRVVGVLRHLPPVALDDYTLVALTQLTEELDDVYFPLNKKSERRSPRPGSAPCGSIASTTPSPRRSSTTPLSPTSRRFARRRQRAASCG